MADGIGALLEGARQLGVPLGEAQATTLLQLLDELSAWNRAYSLTAISDRSEMIRAHLLDSLSAWPDLVGARIADVGTGAGFPGLPLAVVSPERQFLLLDSVGKKIRFVTHAARRLQLAHVTAMQARVEALRPETLRPETLRPETFTPAAPFDTVIARAVAALPELLRVVRPLLGPRTRVVALKGHYPREELAALPRGWRVQAVRAVQVPGLSAERHIVSLVAGDGPPDERDGMPPGRGSG